MTEAGLEAIEPWIDGFLSRLKPGERMRVARKIGQLLRRTNAARIRQNVQPDGSAMEPRKPRKRDSNRLRARKGPMFKRIALARNLRVRARPDEAEVFFGPRASGAATVHHFGLVDKVDGRIPNSIRVRYPARRLLGIPPEDRAAIMDEVLDWLER